MRIFYTGKQFWIYALFVITMGIISCGDDTPEITSSFTYEVVENDGLTVAFTNTSENATTYLWTFGDGETSTEKNPTHSYSENGSYSVSLKAIADDESIESSQSINVSAVEKYHTSGYYVSSFASTSGGSV